jgi:hypothetical protein
MNIKEAVLILIEMKRDNCSFFPKRMYVYGKSAEEEMRFLKNRKLIKLSKLGYRINPKKLEEIALLVGIYYND